MNKKQMRVARNILALLINQLGTWTVTLVLTAVVPGYLGATAFGVYSFSVAYATFFSMCMSLGTGTYLTWRIAREPESAGRLTFNTLTLQIPLILFFDMIAIALLPLFDGDPAVRKLTFVILISMSLTTISSTAISALAGLQNMRKPSTIVLLCSALSTGLAVLGVQLHQSLLYFAFAGLTGQVLLASGILYYMSRNIHIERQIDPQLWLTILRGGIPFFSWSIVLLFYAQVDIAMLKVMVGNAEVGVYAAALRVISIPVFLPTIVVTAILPALAHERNATSRVFQALASRGIRIVMAVGIPAAVGTALLSSNFIPLLHFPGSFDRATPLITILAFNMPMVGLDMVLGTILVSVGRQRAWTMVGVVSAFFNPLVNLWAIPFTQHAYGNGAIGASCVTLATEVIMFIGAMILRPRGVFTLRDTLYIGRCIVASLVMAPVILFLAPRFSAYSHAGVIIVIVCGVLTYAAAAFALGVVQREDINKVTALVQAKMGSKVLQGVSLASDTEPQLAAVASVTSDTSPVYEHVRAQPLRIPGQLEPVFAYLGRLRQAVLPTVAAFRATLRHMFIRSAPLLARVRGAAGPVAQVATIVTLRMGIAAKRVQVRLSTVAHTPPVLLASFRGLRRATMVARITIHIGLEGVARLLNILASKVGFVLMQFESQPLMTMSNRRWAANTLYLTKLHMQRIAVPVRHAAGHGTVRLLLFIEQSLVSASQIRTVVRARMNSVLSQPLTQLGSISRPLTQATRLATTRVQHAISQPLSIMGHSMAHVGTHEWTDRIWTPLGEAPLAESQGSLDAKLPVLPSLGTPASLLTLHDDIEHDLGTPGAEGGQAEPERELIHATTGQHPVVMRQVRTPQHK